MSKPARVGKREGREETGERLAPWGMHTSHSSLHVKEQRKSKNNHSSSGSETTTTFKWSKESVVCVASLPAFPFSIPLAACCLLSVNDNERRCRQMFDELQQWKQLQILQHWAVPVCVCVWRTFELCIKWKYIQLGYGFVADGWQCPRELMHIHTHTAGSCGPSAGIAY